MIATHRKHNPCSQIFSVQVLADVAEPIMPKTTLHHCSKRIASKKIGQAIRQNEKRLLKKVEAITHLREALETLEGQVQDRLCVNRKLKAQLKAVRGVIDERC